MKNRIFPWATLLLAFSLVAPCWAEEQRFDVVAKEAPARTFFEGLVDGSPYNMVFEPGVTGTISIRLKHVTVTEVLDALGDAYGYDYRRMPNGFVIVPPVIQTRLFQVNYLDMERRGTSRTRVESGQVGQGPSGGMQQAGQTGGEASQSGSLSEPPGPMFAGHGGDRQSERVKEITGTSISTRTASDFWRDLESSLKALIGDDHGHNVVVNAQSGIIAVRAMPRELRDVARFLGTLQEVSTRQVVLEAKIVEVELGHGFQAGINWAAIDRNGGRTISGFQTGPQNGFNSGSLLNQPSRPITVGPGGQAITSTAATALGGAFALAVNAADFSAYIELLSTQGKTRVLSSPRVSTLNNQKAVIKAGSDEYFVTGVSSNTVVGTSSATNRDVSLAPFFSGIALDVTPQIAETGEVILHIHPTISDVSEKVKQLTVAGVTDSLPLAFSQVRESDSVVKARSGQLIVIGGLMRTTRSNSDYRVPGLGSLPVLGHLFRSQQRQDAHTELVILLRPVVVSSDDQWNSMVTEPAQ